MTLEATAPVRYADVLAQREFRGLVVAQVLSEIGDQIAKVALALLVLDRTGSALGAAAAFALSFVPGFLGSAFLGPLADRASRRTVMLVSDLARAALLGVLALVALGHAPIVVLFALLLVADLFSPAFDAARNATIPDLLPDPAQSAAGFGLSRSLSLADQVVGLVLGGVVVQLVGTSVAFGLDAVTFALSFLVLFALIAPRPAEMAGGLSIGGVLRDVGTGVREVGSDPVRRMLLLLPLATCIALVTPEALSLSYARDIGVGDAAGGALVAAVVAGAAVGSVLVSRRRPLAQIDLILPMAVGATMLPLLVAPVPGLAVVILVWIAAGVMQAFLVPCITFTTLLTPVGARGRIVGLASAGWALANVVSFLVAGAVSDLTTPSFAIVACSAVGVLAVCAAILTWPGRELRARVRALEEDATAEGPAGR